MREENLRKGLGGEKKRVLKSQVQNLGGSQQKGKWFPRAGWGEAKVRESGRTQGKSDSAQDATAQAEPRWELALTQPRCCSTLPPCRPQQGPATARAP